MANEAQQAGKLQLDERRLALEERRFKAEKELKRAEQSAKNVEQEAKSIQAGFDRRYRVLELKERRADRRLKSLELNISQGRGIRFTSAQAAVAGAVLALLSAVIGGLIQGWVTRDVEAGKSQALISVEDLKARANIELERQKQEAAERLDRAKFETTLILKATEAAKREDQVRNLKFFLNAGFIRDPDGKIAKMDDGAYPSSPPVVASANTDSAELSARLADRPSREFITAGSANQRVPADSPISRLFLAAISGDADLDRSGAVSAVQLFRYLQLRLLVQMPDLGLSPQYGRLPNPEFLGEFRFRVIESSAEGAALGVAKADDPLRRGHALLIGNARYREWPELNQIPKQLNELAQALKNHFETVEVAADLETEPMRQKINSFLRSFGNDRNARLFIYYGGHGYTEAVPERNANYGYITGIDTPSLVDGTAQAFDAARAKAISMQEIRAPLEDVFAKHILIVLDSAFSGAIFAAR